MEAAWTFETSVSYLITKLRHKPRDHEEPSSPENLKCHINTPWLKGPQDGKLWPVMWDVSFTPRPLYFLLD